MTSTVFLNTNTIDITRDPIFNNVTESHARTNIVSVVPVFNQRPTGVEDQEWDYPYNTMTIINITMIGRNQPVLRLELQDISNQATWSTGLLTGIQQAVADINAWL